MKNNRVAVQYSATCTKEKVTAAWGKGFCSKWLLDYVPQTLVLNLEMMGSGFFFFFLLFCFFSFTSGLFYKVQKCK